MDATFKTAPKNCYQLFNIFWYIKNYNFYIPLALILMSSKNEDLYKEVFTQLIRLIKSHSNFNNFADIKIMCDFELGLRRAIKDIFPLCILDG